MTQLKSWTLHILHWRSALTSAVLAIPSSPHCFIHATALFHMCPSSMSNIWHWCRHSYVCFSKRSHISGSTYEYLHFSFNVQTSSLSHNGSTPYMTSIMVINVQQTELEPRGDEHGEIQVHPSVMPEMFL